MQAAPAFSSPLICRRCRAGRRSASGAFTLVEMVLAIGIVAFAFTALLGALPLSLQTYHDAMDATLRADIARKIAAELEQAPFDRVAGSAASRYFSDQGLEVASFVEARFRVTAAVADKTTIFSVDNAALKPVNIVVYRAAEPPATARPLSTMTVFVPDNGLRGTN